MALPIGVIGLAVSTAILAIVAGALALTGFGDAARAEEAFEGLAVAAIAFTFVVLTTPRVLRSVAERR